MKRFLGKAKETAPAGPPPTLGDASGKMDARLKDIEAKIAKCDEDIKKQMARPGPQQKQMVMQVMKRKKMYEQQRDQVVGTQFNVDSLAFAQEQAEVTAMSVEAMREGHKNLKEAYKKMDIGNIESLMDDLADFADEAKEINEAISQSFAVPDGFDEGSFEEEYAALEEEIKMEALTGVGALKPSYLPAAAPSAAAAPEAAAASATSAQAGPPAAALEGAAAERAAPPGA